MLPNVEIPVVVGSILEADTVSRIKSHRTNFDIVHAWGVLHHTGEMWKAIDICTEFVAPDGLLILSIYNRHWSSFSWKCIKWCYNISPQFVKWLMVKSFYLIIYVAKFLVTGKNPLKKERGMNFYYDIIDWLGGYPYEYASIAEICNYLETNNFTSISVKKAKVPTGCNEFHFAPKAK
jgi:2-polyprenyl-6-hydroxyphenyl methylase/3-demethylubiquinone-9 3-methyltransferase